MFTNVGGNNSFNFNQFWPFSDKKILANTILLCQIFPKTEAYVRSEAYVASKLRPVQTGYIFWKVRQKRSYHNHRSLFL